MLTADLVSSAILSLQVSNISWGEGKEFYTVAKNSPLS